MTSGCVGDHDERTETLDGLLLCKWHRRRMDHDVREISALIVDTQRIVDGGAPTDASPQGKAPKKRADPPAPGSVEIMALFDPRTKAATLPLDTSTPMPAVLAVVASWLLLVTEERRLTGILPKSVLAQLELLKRHHEWLAAQPFIDDYLLEMAELRKALAHAVRDQAWIRLGYCDLPGEAGACGGVLSMENGSDTVQCRRCRASWTDPRERARLAMRL